MQTFRRTVEGSVLKERNDLARRDPVALHGQRPHRLVGRTQWGAVHRDRQFPAPRHLSGEHDLPWGSSHDRRVRQRGHVDTAVARSVR